MSLIFDFVLTHSPSFLESPNYRIEFLDTPIEYENAVENSHGKKRLKGDLQLRSSDKTIISLICSKFAKYFQFT